MTPRTIAVAVIVLLATAGLAGADHDVPQDPFADEDFLFDEEETKDPFEPLLEDAPEIPSDDEDEDEGEDGSDPQPEGQEETNNDAPMPALALTLAVLGIAARARRP